MTPLFPDNLLSHRESWLKAFERLIELEPESFEPDMDEKGYWRHERDAMLDMYADVDARSAKAFWTVEEHTVWRGIDPEKPVWHSLGFCCPSWEDANDLLEYLQHNVPSALLRVARHRLGV